MKKILIMVLTVFFSCCYKKNKEIITKDIFQGSWVHAFCYEDTIIVEPISYFDEEKKEFVYIEVYESIPCISCDYLELTFSDSIIKVCDEFNNPELKYYIKNDSLFFSNGLEYKYQVVPLNCSSILLKNSDFEFIIKKDNLINLIPDTNYYYDYYYFRKYSNLINYGLYDYDDLLKYFQIVLSRTPDLEFEEEIIPINRY